MSTRTIGIVMNGITGRMGYRQHLVRSILAIRDQGGVELSDGTRLQVDPILVGRNAERVKEIADRHNVGRWTTDLTEALSGDDEIYFDAQLTTVREESILQAIAAGKARLHGEADLASRSRGRCAWPGRPGRRASRTASSTTSSICPDCSSSSGSSTAASSAASSRCAASSATGSSRVTGRQRNGRAGTTAPRTAAA